MEKKTITEQLQQIFPSKDIEFRVGATNGDKTMGLALAYVQARAIQSRLDQVLGMENWKVSYREITGGFLCTLSLYINGEWISKEDGANITDFESIKGGISNAFKRVAASGFGIGRYLYSCKQKWYPIKSQGRGYAFIEEPTLSFEEKETEKVTYNNSRNSVILTFGKYKGKTVEEVLEMDEKYIYYLLDKSKDVEILEECQRLLKRGA